MDEIFLGVGRLIKELIIIFIRGLFLIDFIIKIFVEVVLNINQLILRLGLKLEINKLLEEL